MVTTQKAASLLDLNEFSHKRAKLEGILQLKDCDDQAIDQNDCYTYIEFVFVSCQPFYDFDWTRHRK